MSTSPDLLADAFAGHLAEAVAALLGETAVAAPSAGPVDAGWAATLSCTGALEGHIVIGLPEADGRRISGLVMGMDQDASDDAVIDTLREVCGQAAGAVSQADAGQGLRLAVLGVERATGAFPGRAYTFTLPGDFAPRLVIRPLLEDAPAEASAPPMAAAVAAAAAGETRRDQNAQSVRNLDVILDIELPLAVRFGQTELPLLSLVRLGPGSVIDLKRSADEPVDVLVSGKVIARGEVVVVDGNYGVRVTEIVSTAERIRSLGA